jgi:hypothetical protein
VGNKIIFSRLFIKSKEKGFKGKKMLPDVSKFESQFLRLETDLAQSSLAFPQPHQT